MMVRDSRGQDFILRGCLESRERALVVRRVESATAFIFIIADLIKARMELPLLKSTRGSNGATSIIPTNICLSTAVSSVPASVCRWRNRSGERTLSGVDADEEECGC